MENFDGLEFMSRAVVATHNTDQLRLRKAILSTVKDLVVNDEGIMPEVPTCVRTYFAGRRDVLQVLLETISYANLEKPTEY